MKKRILINRISNPIAKISILILFVLFFSSCLDEPKIIEVSTSNFSFSKSKINMVLNVNISNDNFFKLDFEKIEFKIYLNDSYLTSIQDSTIRVLKANKTTQIVLPVEVKYAEMINNMENFMKVILGQKSYVKIEGTVKYKILLFHKETQINKITEIN